MDLERKKHKSSERELLHQFILLVEQDQTEKDPEILLKKNIEELQKTLKNLKDNLSPSGSSPQTEQFNQIFNEIQRLETLQANYSYYRKDLEKLIEDKDYRHKLSKTIDKMDHQSDKPPFLKNLLKKITSLFGR